MGLRLGGELAILSDVASGLSIVHDSVIFNGPNEVYSTRLEMMMGYNQLGPNSIIFNWLETSPASAMLSDCMPKADRPLDQPAEVRDMSGYNAAHRYYARPFLDSAYWSAGPIQNIITITEHLTRCQRDYLKPIFTPLPVIPREQVSTWGNEQCIITPGSAQSDPRFNTSFEYSTYGWYIIEVVPLSRIGWDEPPVYERRFVDICSSQAPALYSDGIDETAFRSLVRTRVEGILAATKALPAFSGDPTAAAEYVDTWVIFNELQGGAVAVGWTAFWTLDETYKTFVDDGLGVVPKFQIFESDSNWADKIWPYYNQALNSLQNEADNAYPGGCPWEIDTVKTHWYEHFFDKDTHPEGRLVTVNDMLSYYGQSGDTGRPERDHLNHFEHIRDVWAFRLAYSIAANSKLGIGEYAECSGSAGETSGFTHPTGASVQSWAGAWHWADVMCNSLSLGCSHIHLMYQTGAFQRHARVALNGSKLSTSGIVNKFLCMYFAPYLLEKADNSVEDPNVGVWAATDASKEWLRILVINRCVSEGVYITVSTQDVGVGADCTHEVDYNASHYKHTLSIPPTMPWVDFDETSAEVATEAFFPTPAETYSQVSELVANRSMVIFQIKIKPANADDSIQFQVGHTEGFEVHPEITRAPGAGVAVWNWGDGSTEVGDSLWHTYSAAGPYTITLTIANIHEALTEINQWWSTSQGYLVGDYLGSLQTCRALTLIRAYQHPNLSSDCSNVNLQWWPNLVTLDLHGSGIHGSVANWVLPDSLIYMYIYDTIVNGDISGWVLNDALEYLWLSNMGVTGDISGWVLPDSLIDLQIFNTPVSGDISSWVLPPLLNTLTFRGPLGLTGDISNWVFPTSLLTFYMADVAITGAIGWDVLPAGLEALNVSHSGLTGSIATWIPGDDITEINLAGTALAGGIGSWVLPAGLTYLNLSGTAVEGDIGSWVLPAGLTSLNLSGTDVEGDIGSWVLPAGLTYLNLSNPKVDALVGDIASWILPATLVTLDLTNSDVSGNISGWVLPAALVTLSLHYSNVSGSISGWVLPAAFVTLDMYNTAVTGDISGWVLAAPLAYLQLSWTDVSGVVSGWVLPATLRTLSLGSTALSGDLSGWVLPAALTGLGLSQTAFAGNISGWVLPAGLLFLQVQSTSFTGSLNTWVLPAALISFAFTDAVVTGDISGWVLPSTLQSIAVQNTSVTGSVSSWIIPEAMQIVQLSGTLISGTPSFAVAVYLRYLYVDDCGLSTAEVDAWVTAVYNRRMAQTWPLSHTLVVGSTAGSNGAPTGTVQAPSPCPPANVGEMIWELAKDSCASGHLVWSVTWNGGTIDP